MARRCKGLAPLLGLVVLAVLLAGCASSAVQGTKYTAFKESTAALAQDTRTSYKGVLGLQEDLYAECLVRFDDTAPYKHLLDGEPVPCRDAHKAPIDAKSPKALLETRLTALDALVRYATLLNTLATTDYAAGVDASTAKLTASLDKLRASITPILPEDKKLETATTILGQAVQAAGRLYVDGQRKEALRKVLTNTQQSIATLSKHMVLDNSQIESLTTVYARSYVSLVEKGRPQDQERRRQYDAKVLLEYKTGMALKDSLAALGAAAGRLPAAHAELLKSLDAPGAPLNDLEAFVAAVEQAFAIVQQLKNS